MHFFCIFGTRIKFPMLLKKISLIAQVLLKLLTPRDVLVYMHNSACFKKAYCSERVNESQKLVQYAGKNFYPIFSSFWAKLS